MYNSSQKVFNPVLHEIKRLRQKGIHCYDAKRSRDNLSYVEL